jgi:hypothetical protein
MPRGFNKVLHGLMSFHDIENLIPLKEPADKSRIIRFLMVKLDGEDSDLPQNNLME